MHIYTIYKVWTIPMADALRDYGIATWNIEYRRADSKGGGWPGTFKDVANATDYLPKIAKKYSLNLNRVIVIGHSAGGHLALWLAGRHNLKPSGTVYVKNPLKLIGVIDLDGVPNLKTYRPYGKPVCNRGIIPKLLGTKNNKLLAIRYKQASPSNLLPFGIPQILIYGESDTAVALVMAKNYYKRVKLS